MFLPVTRILMRNFSLNMIAKSFHSNKSCFTKLQSVSSSCGLFLNSKSSVIRRCICISSQVKRQEEETISLTFVKSDGQRVQRTARVGHLLQEVIDDDSEFDGYGVCGGTLTCSTCHVILSPEFYATLPPMSCDEMDLIVYAPGNCETSRLGCGIRVTKEMEGAVITIPEKIADIRLTECVKAPV